MANFAERFKELRQQRNLTQEEIAEEFYLNKSSISRYERGQQMPEIELLRKLAAYFDVSVDYLLGNSDNVNGDSISKDVYVPETIAAHFDGDNYTEDDLKDIEEFLEFVKMRNEKKNKDK